MSQRKFSYTIFLTAVFLSMGYGLFVVFLDFTEFPKYLPDDAFYYLQIAQTYAEQGIYSFDNGFSFNTGFHLLWFYILVGLSKLSIGDPAQLLTLATACSWIISFSTLSMVAFYCYRRFPETLIALALMISGYGFINNQISAMEWPFCIAISTLIYLAFINDKLNQNILVFLILGILGSLARTDFGGVAVAFLVAAYIVQLKLKDKVAIKPAWFLFFGALLGFLIVSYHNYYITGDWMSTSVRMKQNWANASPINPLAPFLQFLRSPLYILSLTGDGRVELQQKIFASLLYITPVVFIIFATIIWYFRDKFKPTYLTAINSLSIHPKIFCLTLTSFFCLLGYLLLYSINILGMQSWYSAHVFVPMTFLLMVLLNFLALNNIRTMMISIIITIIIVINFTLFFSVPATYSFQVKMRDSGLAVADGVANKILPNYVGLSDAGIAGYYSGGHVVNLDGLVNQDIVNYFPNRLPCYYYDHNLEIAGGFGTTERISNNIDWYLFAENFHYQNNNGQIVKLKKFNLSKINELYDCSKENNLK